MRLEEGLSSRRGRRALVIFSGKADLPWLRLLRPGFRHCLIAVEGEGGWVVIDPLSHRTDISFRADLERGDLQSGFEAAGCVCVPTCLRTPEPRPAPWRPFTCVEAVIRVLGMRKPWVFTPWQLYRTLTEEG